MCSITLHTVYYTLHTIHCILYTTHCILHTVYYTLHTAYCIVPTVYLSLYLHDVHFLWKLPLKTAPAQLGVSLSFKPHTLPGRRQQLLTCNASFARQNPTGSAAAGHVFYTALHCTVLHCTVLHCTGSVLYCTALADHHLRAMSLKLF